jgi:TolB-like protein/class 3 adenylate cyclase/Tfp pilus assembly protein PilF
MSAELTHRQAAVLAADVAGYSRLMSIDGPGTVAALDRARAVFRQRIAEHRGSLIDMAGDSVLAVFDDTVDAVRTALAVQAEVARVAAEEAEERRMRYRIGVHLGEILQKADGTVYGDGVNIAARLQTLAEVGGITVSVGVAEAVREQLDAHFLDQGEQLVKNIPYPVHAFRWVTADRQTPFGAVPHEARQTSHPSLAVLPFANLSNDPEQEYFADGIAEDLITALSRLRWLNVIARNSSFIYKGRTLDMRALGGALGARYILEGSVRNSGGRVRISCRLVDASNGNQVWSERYDRELAQAFDLQDEITLTIAGTIEPELSRAEQERVRRKPVDNMDAWDLFQRGLWHFWKYTQAAHVEARRLFQAAAAVDPNFAPAHAYLALSYFSSFINGLDSSEQSFRLARETATRALALDDKEPMARFVLGRVHTQAGQWQAGVDELQTAVTLNPSFAQAHYGLGAALLGMGRWEEAVEACATAQRLSPHDPMLPVFQSIRASALSYGGRLDEAEVLARAATRHPTTNFWNIATLASVLGHRGRLQEAAESVAKLLEIRADFSEQMFARFFGKLDQAPRAAGSRVNSRVYFFEGLYKAGLPQPANAQEPA